MYEYIIIYVNCGLKNKYRSDLHSNTTNGNKLSISWYKVLIYDIHIFSVIDSLLHGSLMNQHNDLLPVGSLAQLFEDCTSTAEVMGSIYIQAWIFLGFIHYCLSSVHFYKDHCYIHDPIK